MLDHQCKSSIKMAMRTHFEDNVGTDNMSTLNIRVIEMPPHLNIFGMHSCNSNTVSQRLSLWLTGVPICACCQNIVEAKASLSSSSSLIFSLTFPFLIRRCYNSDDHMISTASQRHVFWTSLPIKQLPKFKFFDCRFPLKKTHFSLLLTQNVKICVKVYNLPWRQELHHVTMI